MGCGVTQEIGLMEESLMEGFGATGKGGFGLRNGEARGLARESTVAMAGSVVVPAMAVAVGYGG